MQSLIEAIYGLDSYERDEDPDCMIEKKEVIALIKQHEQGMDEAVQWLPMETAPRNGAHVLVRFAGNDKDNYFSTWICEVAWKTKPLGEFAAQRGLRGPSGWYCPQEGSGVEMRLNYFNRETGWLPLSVLAAMQANITAKE